MGGDQSRLSVSVTDNVVMSAVQDVTQDCINSVDSSNVIDVTGGGNIVDRNTQKVSVKIKSNCIQESSQNAQFESKLQDTIAQSLKTQSVAMTQWLDNSSNDADSTLNQNISASVLSESVQTCLNTIATDNKIVADGYGNIITNNSQEDINELMSDCLLRDGQTSAIVNNLTNTVNQHSVYKSENPFAFITDSIAAVTKSAMLLFAAIFIIIVCFVGIFLALRDKKKPMLPPLIIGRATAEPAAETAAETAAATTP